MAKVGIYGDIEKEKRIMMDSDRYDPGVSGWNVATGEHCDELYFRMCAEHEICGGRFVVTKIFDLGNPCCFACGRRYVMFEGTSWQICANCYYEHVMDEHGRRRLPSDVLKAAGYAWKNDKPLDGMGGGMGLQMFVQAAKEDGYDGVVPSDSADIRALVVREAMERARAAYREAGLE